MQHERETMLTRSALQELRRSIEEASGRDAADEILFRLGRRWGSTDAAAIGLAGTERERFERGLLRMDELGLGTATLETFQLAPERRSCRISGRVLDPEELRRSPGDEPPAGESCGVTVGYLTGLASTLTGLDLVCTPFSCRGDCAPAQLGLVGCRFELLPAHTQTSRGAAAPSGSARFFLGSLGASLGGGDIALGDLLENAGDAIVLIDDRDVVRFWNRGAENMFGYERDEVVGRKVGFIVPPDLLESGELARIQRLIEREGVLKNYVTRRITKEGRELRVSMTRTILQDRRGNVIGSTAIIRDITEQLRTEEELHQARQLAMVGEMAATVAHQVKNPLAGIYAAIQYLSRGLEESDEKKEVFENIGAEIRRMDDTIQDLLRFARPLPPHPAPTALRSVLEDLRESLSMNPEVARHELRIDVPAEYELELDEGMMEQVFQNLVLNAAQAMDEPGTIRVSATRDGDRVVVVVEDDGPGIPPELEGSIFDPFITSKVRGTGLGLSIARKNVEAHGGTIEVERGAGGARFRISLPLEQRRVGKREGKNGRPAR